MTLDEWMRAKGKTNAEVAGLAGVSPPFISRIRHGKRQPSLPVAQALSKITKLPMASFIRGADA